jgi:hypothetical protein
MNFKLIFYALAVTKKYLEKISKPKRILIIKTGGTNEPSTKNK